MQEKRMGILSRIIVCVLMIVLIGTMAFSSVSDAIGFSAAMALEGGGAKGADDAREQQAPPQTRYSQLKEGDTGEAVLKMKLRLYELGYFETDALNEIYDKETTEEIALFQELNELEATGIADAETLALLFSDQAKGPEQPEQKKQSYILNTNTKKFHEPDCKSVKQMKEKNKKEFTGTRDQAIDAGYQPCKNCNP